LAANLAAEPNPDASDAVTADFLPKLFDDLASGAVQLDEAVTQLADRDRERDIALVLGARLALEHSIVERSLARGAQDAATMLCRAAGLGVNGYSAILRMRRRRGHALNGSFSSLVAGYAKRPRLTPGELAEALAIDETAAEPA
jgi:hypothetical protein